MINIPLLTDLVKDILRSEDHYDHYVWMTAITLPTDETKPHGGYYHTIEPMIKWIENSDITCWDYDWHHNLDCEFKDKLREAGPVLDFIVYFRFTKPEDAMLFKLSWSEHLPY